MKVISAVFLSLLTISTTSASGNVGERLLTTCAPLEGCYIRNISTGAETELMESVTFEYSIQAQGQSDFSIKCNVNYAEGQSDFIKFFYEGKVVDEFAEPRWMDGDSNAGDYIVPVAYLSTCGEKTVKLQGHVWSNMCFEKEFKLVANCNDIPPTSTPPITAPTAMPLPLPSTSPSATPQLIATRKPNTMPQPLPTRQPTAKPYLRPTRKPTAKPQTLPTRKPTTKPTRKPTTKPTRKPTAKPTRKPTRKPTAKPTRKPTRKPTNKPTRKPTAKPTRKPTRKPTAKPLPKPTPKPTRKPTQKPVASNPCKVGFKLVHGECVPCVPDWCHSTYQCPVHAKKTAGRECIYSIWDCTCDAGYTKQGEACVWNPCGEGMKKSKDGRCVPDWCVSTYQCPAHSKIATGKEKSCLFNIWDCACDSGYKIEGNACVPTGGCQ